MLVASGGFRNIIRKVFRHFLSSFALRSTEQRHHALPAIIIGVRRRERERTTKVINENGCFTYFYLVVFNVATKKNERLICISSERKASIM